MPESAAPILVILLATCAGLLILVLLLVLRISSRLSRMERAGGHSPSHTEPVVTVPTQAETSPGGAFEAFLAEDSSRRELPKGEQFSAYRQWRHDKGMNWSNS